MKRSCRITVVVSFFFKAKWYCVKGRTTFCHFFFLHALLLIAAICRNSCQQWLHFLEIYAFICYLISLLLSFTSMLLIWHSNHCSTSAQKIWGGKEMREWQFFYSIFMRKMKFKYFYLTSTGTTWNIECADGIYIYRHECKILLSIICDNFRNFSLLITIQELFFTKTGAFSKHLPIF